MAMGERLDTGVVVAPSLQRAEECGLVLEAIGIACRIHETEGGWAILVAARDARRAGRTLAAYEAENREQAAVGGAAPPEYGRNWLGSVVAAFLVLAFVATGPREGRSVWFERGSASAQRIVSGELWRAVTALTLHSDPVHVISNAAASVILITAVGWWLGPGVGIWLVLLAGAGGNALTALAYGSRHIAVGASTATFGAVGILASRQIVARRRRPWSRRTGWVAVGAGLALLAMLGTGAGTDILAHFFGLLVGGALGMGAALILGRPPGRFVQWLLCLAAAAFVLACWAVARATVNHP